MRPVTSVEADQRLTERAYVLIRERILGGQLPFGATVSRRELAAELGMSTLPVSEALQRLKNEGLIETVARVGTRVRMPTPQDIRGFYVVREALESQAARLFCEKASRAARQELIESAAELDAAYGRCAEKEPSAEELYELRKQHMKFHVRIAEHAECPFLCEAIEWNQIFVFNWFFDRLFGYPGLPENWHTQLAQALTGRNAELADREMRKHVRYRMDELLQRLEPFFRIDKRHFASAVNGFSKALSGTTD